ncbi:MAG: 3'(2'),5'-bisphosphate nucleotidase CysQ [Caulobacter sp.]|nr:3'(2'),5'-bisphosphate nucleotidase CysQ [Caulobacter sp.]
MTEDLALIEAAAREAGAEARRLKAAGLKTWAKDGGSPVTNADLAVDALLRTGLGEARPDYGWLSEETADDPARLDRRRLFVVDPIDGTVAFLKDKPWWTVCIAVVEDGQPVAACIHAPDLDETFVASRGGGAWRNGERIAAGDCAAIEDCRMLAAVKMFSHPAWPTPWPPMQVEARNSVAYRLCLVADGRFDAALALSSKCEWDLAAAELICAEAGAVVTDHRGRAFSYNRPNPQFPSLIAATPALHPLILERVRHIDLPD